MKLSPHAVYMTAAVPWLDNLPAHWSTAPLWSLFRRSKRTGHENERLLSVYRDHGVIYKDSRNDNANRASEDLSSYQLVEPGDLVINKMKAWQGSVAVSSLRGIVSPAYFVFRPSHDHDPRFLHFLLRSRHYIDGYKSISKGIRVAQWDLDPDKHRVMPVLLPDKSEQNEIVSFLDRATVRTESLIARKLKFIELLREKRIALITSAMTGSMQKFDPQTETGVYWASSLPQNWSIIPFKLACWYQEGPGILAIDFMDDGVPLLRVAGVQGRFASTFGCDFLDPEKVQRKWGHFRLSLGDILISASATVGTITEVGPETVGAVPYTGIIRMRPSGRVTRSFLSYFLGSSIFLEQVNLMKQGSTIQHFGPTHLSRVRMPVPPKEEQIRITSALDRQTDRIEVLIAKTERSIELLKEHRSALISAAVTGKIDVRGIAAKNMKAAA